jgi:5-methylcytosine-specific restriction endonuclease McrA
MTVDTCQSPVSVKRVSPLSQSSESHERTDERTDVEGLTADLSSADRSARGRVDDVLQRDRTNDIEDALDELEWRAAGPHRWPLIRTGQRDDIPWITRCAVYARDNGMCQVCGLYRPKPSNLDHIVPWSAGGCDHAHNLRLTCEPCNQDRSNYRDHAEHIRKRPVTWWCATCYPVGYTWLGHGDCSPGVNCRVPAVTQRGELPSRWYVKPEPIDPELADVFAFCAHCRDYGYTEARCAL